MPNMNFILKTCKKIIFVHISEVTFIVILQFTFLVVKEQRTFLNSVVGLSIKNKYML